MNNCSVIIVAGGKGSRFGSITPKQFLTIGRTTIIEHTINQFYNALSTVQIIIVLPKQHLNYGKDLLKHYSNLSFAIGGETRFHSVKNGLKYLKNDVDLVGVHDAVRPLVSQSTIIKTFQAAQQYGAAIPAIPIKDSLRKKTANFSKAVSRKHLYAVQTPQCFEQSILLKAYQQEYKEDFTDDASVVEAAGNGIQIVEGNEENFKITTPPDLRMASLLIKNEAIDKKSF